MQTVWPILGFINPQIADDLWPITALVALVAGLGAYHLPRHMNASSWVLIGGLVITLSSIAWMLAITHGLVNLTPAEQSYTVRLSFLLCFAGLAMAFGWTMFCFMNPPKGSCK